MLIDEVVVEQMSPVGSASPMSGEAAVAISDDCAAGVDGVDDAVGLAGDEVDGAGGRWTKGGAEGVVVHRVVLGVVPHRGDGVAVVVAHGEGCGGGDAGAAVAADWATVFAVPTESGKRSILPLSKACLLVGVVVVLVGGECLRAVEAEGIGGASAIPSIGCAVYARFGLAVSRLGSRRSCWEWVFRLRR